jgi:AraC-like DNA-binding protein
MFFQDVVDFSDETYLQKDSHLLVRMSFAIIFFASVITYTVLTFVKLINFRKTIEAQFSYQDAQVRLFWLNFIAILFSLSGLVVIIAGAYNAIMFKKVIDTSFLSHIGLTTVAYCISYFGLRQPVLFRAEYTVNEEEEVEPDSSSKEEKEVKNRFSEQEAEELTERLILHMNEERPYLKSELTLGELSAQINLAKHELTELLNVHIGKNFFTFVNEFRLKAVVRRLSNPDYDHLTIMGIAHDCGFNSKSTFNSLFKQFTGKTPSEYKKTLRQKEVAS